jgi:hypothetical protein
VQLLAVEPEHRALSATRHVPGIGAEEVDRLEQSVRYEQVIVIGHHGERRRHARQRVREFSEVIRIARVVRIADVLDVESGELPAGDSGADGFVAAAISDQDAASQLLARRIGKPALRVRHAVLQRKQDGEMVPAAHRALTVTTDGTFRSRRQLY